jgi:putative flippase GtrA
MTTITNEHTVLVEHRPETVDMLYETARPRTSTSYGLPHPARTSRRGRHRKPRLLKKIGSEHGRRLASFSLIGFGLFAAGIAAQAFLVQVVGIPKEQAFIIQLALSVQVNFLANYHWTWGDRDAPFWRSWWRYNIKRLGGILLTFVLYPVLVRLGMNYLAANALLIAALTPANYVLGHFWTFAIGDQVASEK